jgi:excisionase family DNA binding protein
MAARAAIPRRYITITEAAEYLGVTERTIRAMISDGRLLAHRNGSRIIRLRVDEIDNAMSPVGGGAL